jgi:hypothetical protein
MLPQAGFRRATSSLSITMPDSRDRALRQPAHKQAALWSGSYSPATEGVLRDTIEVRIRAPPTETACDVLMEHAMDINAISKFFAELRVSRRQVGTGMAGALLASGQAPSSGLAQGATPVAGQDAEFLFVQSFGGGTLASAGDGGAYTLTLEQGLGDTVYFADRPGREVGAMATSDFITVFDTNDADPPNAALVSGDMVLVLELTGATLDEAEGTLVYEVTSIGEQHVDLQFGQEISDAPTEDMTLDTCHLFIDSLDNCCDPVHRPWCC